ncbi:MAG TPA: hypothetical protein VLV55_00315 [Rhizomicrobium sp.]|nr:hypothetical protein [Rhizomicrobium sp.]
MRPFTLLAAILFLALAAVHAYRLFADHFDIVIAGHDVPLMASWGFLAVGLVLGLMLLTESK